MQRGIITNILNIQTGPESVTLSSGNILTEEDFRFYALYWDKVVIPTNLLLHQSIPEEDELISSGIVERPSIQFPRSFSSGEAGEILLGGHCELAKNLMSDPSCDWVIHQQGQSIFLPEDLVVEKNVFRANLSSALPVPSKEIPLCDVLEFKIRRKDELTALHEALDDIYLQILKSPDPSLASKNEFKKLSSELDNLNKVSKESFSQQKKFDLTTEINLNGKDVAQAAASGAVIDLLVTGMAIPIATVAAAAGSMFKISLKSSRTFTHASGNTKLGYLSSAAKEGIING